MTSYMLDTNIVSHLIKQHPIVVKRIISLDMNSLAISTMTEAELLYGLAKRPKAIKLRRAISEFLMRVTIIAWNSTSSKYYADVRAQLEKRGKLLSPFDLMIASHTLQTNSILVTSDQAFNYVPGLKIEDWAK